MREFLYAVLIILGTGLVAAALIFVSHKFFFKNDDSSFESEVAKHLPNRNCGACGFVSCSECAKAIACKKAPVGVCKILTQNKKHEIEKLLGICGNEKCGGCAGGATGGSAGTSGKMCASKQMKERAVVHCQGGYDAEFSNVYAGEKSCRLANNVCGGNLVCSQGCLGFGDCIAACPVGAIILENGRALVTDKCIACGVCVEVCPKKLITLKAAKKAQIRCIKQIENKCCVRECIRCGECAKACKFSAVVKTKQGAYEIDSEKCVGCKACVKVCPNKCIEMNFS